MIEQLLLIVGGLIFSVLGYFLRKTMDELKDVKQMSYDNRSQIELIKLEYKNRVENLTEKFDELKLTMSELIKEIKELNKRIHGN